MWPSGGEGSLFDRFMFPWGTGHTVSGIGRG